ncbi:MAG: hypothetical protein AAB434_04755 [Planctomycetota bacterium]
MNSTLRTASSILCVAAGSAVLALYAGRWKDVKCEEGGYAVQMPGAPEKIVDEPIQTELGTIQTYTQGVEVKGIRYWVTYGDLPETFLNEVPTDTLLAYGRWGIAGNGKGQLLQDEPIELNGIPGQALLARDFNANVHKARLYLSGARLYEVSVRCPHHLKDSPEIERFLGSFRIVQ